MFFCEQCAADMAWPTSYFKSYGRCEMCAAHGICNDVRSGDLPATRDDVARARVQERYKLNTRPQKIITEEP